MTDRLSPTGVAASLSSDGVALPRAVKSSATGHATDNERVVFRVLRADLARRMRQPELRKDGQVPVTTDTLVTFPAGGITADAEVVAVVDGGFVTDVSPFHPVDHGWPDQGPDRGTVIIGEVEVEIVDVVLGATDGSNLLIATNIPVRRGEVGWAFVVVHYLAEGSPVPPVGSRVELRVDADHRAALSAGHTGCHLAALALNAATSARWSKPVVLDGLGHANFDQLALTTSRIRPNGSTDSYRLGKSLRKKGFDAVDLPVDDIANVANAHLARWVELGATIHIDAEGPHLTDRRSWVCNLPEGTERIPCGGTHLTSLAGVLAIEVALTLDGQELIMETNVTLR